jgi:hypothetical protein
LRRRTIDISKDATTSDALIKNSAVIRASAILGLLFRRC